jgi:predicted NUDIX family phosphoesterase
MNHPELILVIPRSEFEARGAFHGFHPTDAQQNAGAYLTNDPDEKRITKWIPRDYAETDEDYLQIIPYIMLVSGQDVFMYSRNKKSGEARLHDKLSIGVGGHVEGEEHHHPFGAYIDNTLREIQEEVGLELHSSILEGTVLGLLHDSMTEVGRVHLGVLHAIHISPSQAKTVLENAEDTKTDPVFTNLFDLAGDLERFNALEPWSQWALTRLIEVAKRSKPWENQAALERFRYLALASAELSRASSELLMQHEGKAWMVALENAEAAMGGVSCILSALSINKDIDLRQVAQKEREFYDQIKTTAQHQDWTTQDAGMAGRGL